MEIHSSREIVWPSENSPRHLSCSPSNEFNTMFLYMLYSTELSNYHTKINSNHATLNSFEQLGITHKLQRAMIQAALLVTLPPLAQALESYDSIRTTGHITTFSKELTNTCLLFGTMSKLIPWPPPTPTCAAEIIRNKMRTDHVGGHLVGGMGRAEGHTRGPQWKAIPESHTKSESPLPGIIAKQVWML